MVYCLDYSKTAHCRIISVQLFGYKVVDYINSLRNTSRYESHYNTKNSVHEYYYMLRWVSMQLQKSTFAASINAWILAV